MSSCQTSRFVPLLSMISKGTFLRTVFSLSVFLLIQSFSFLSAQSNRPMISAISAEGTETGVIISWTKPPAVSNSSIKNLRLYRSYTPITGPAALQTLSPVANLNPLEFSYVDTPSNTTNYYYAIVSVLNDGTVYDVIIPSVNATVLPAGVPSSQKTSVSAALDSAKTTEAEKHRVSPEETLRNTPLPYLNVMSKADRSTETIPQELLDSAELLGISAQKKTEARKPFIFEKDSKDTSTGDDYSLYAIISTYFARADYKAAEVALRRFLSINHTTDITARTNIYLGQSLFFQQKYQDALSYFLLAESIYPAIAKRWIRFTLDDFSIPQQNR